MSSEPISWRKDGLEPDFLTSSPLNIPKQCWIGEASKPRQFILGFLSWTDHKQSIFKKEDLRFLSLVPASSLPIHTHMNYLADCIFKQELLGFILLILSSTWLDKVRTVTDCRPYPAVVSYSSMDNKVK